MTNTTWTSSSYHSTDAIFRTWGQAVNTALAAVGMVNTSDTGQINWSTVTRASINTDAGYEVWKFDDALQSTVPIFFKLYYGTGTNASYARLRIEVGTASNGSGTLSGTGSGTTTTIVTHSSGTAATSFDNWMSSDGSGLAFTAWGNSSNSVKSVLVIDRFRDADGTAGNKGWYWQYRDIAASTKGATIINVIDGAASVLTYNPCMVPMAMIAQYSYLDSSSRVMGFPHYVACKQGLFYSKMILSCYNYDLGYDSIQTVTHLGSSCTFRSVGTNFSGMSVDGSTSVSYMMWWS